MIKGRARDAVRIIELPACKMVWSGICPGDHSTAKNEKLRHFNQWWPTLDALRADRFFSRDFMWWDTTENGFAWGLAVTEPPADTGGYELMDFPGGLYAVGAYDGGAQAVYASIKKWVEKSGCFCLDDERHCMWHAICSREAMAAMGYGQFDLYVPIRAHQN